MTSMKNTWILTGAISLLVALNGTTKSSGYAHEWEDNDHAYDRARRAVDRGEILPMAQLLTSLKARVPGEVVGVELEHEHGTWMYEFKIIDAKGRLIEVYLDARTGTVLAMEKD